MGGSACEDAGRSDIIFHSVDLAGCAFSVEVPPDLLSEKILLEEGRFGVWICDVNLLHLFVNLIVRSLVHPTSAGHMGATKLIRLVVGRHSCSGNGLISSPFLYHHWLGYHHREGHTC